MRCAFVGLVSRTTERDSESMTWKPDRRQIDLIAEYGAAHMPVEAIAAALDIHPDDLRGWIGKLAATRSQPRYVPPELPPVLPQPANRPGRILSERVFGLAESVDDDSQHAEQE
jgi:hypothetical protein